MNDVQNIDQLLARRPITVGYEDLIQKASDLMNENRIRHLPVTDQNGEVIGIISQRDVQKAVGVKWIGTEAKTEIAPHLKVKDFMSSPPKTVLDNMPLDKVITHMIREKISAILVKSAVTGVVRGMVTTEDILNAFAQLA